MLPVLQGQRMPGVAICLFAGLSTLCWSHSGQGQRVKSFTVRQLQHTSSRQPGFVCCCTVAPALKGPPLQQGKQDSPIECAAVMLLPNCQPLFPSRVHCCGRVVKASFRMRCLLLQGKSASATSSMWSSNGSWIFLKRATAVPAAATSCSRCAAYLIANLLDNPDLALMHRWGAFLPPHASACGTLWYLGASRASIMACLASPAGAARGGAHQSGCLSMSILA